MCGPRKHNCQPFCGPEGRFHCSDSVCSLRPAPFSYLCVRVRILGVLRNCLLLFCRIKACLPSPSAVVSIFTDSAACVLSFYHSTPLHKIQCLFSCLCFLCFFFFFFFEGFLFVSFLVMIRALSLFCGRW